MTELREIIARAIEDAFDGPDGSMHLTIEMLVAAALAAIKEAGLVVVPREPTEAILNAGFEDYPTIWTAAITEPDRVGVYTAIIEAAEAGK